ncbi:uncharacterized protein LOC134678827 [Cydia fagiglandana]|uniref:uncharacterized protein LOC134678827 n=1 Tax=Cydia fagiglandana TaxID=1458189 RepID=UPI002FEE633D
MRIVSIRGDGNCLFRSIAYCVYHNQERHREVRMKVIDTVVKNWHRYKDFIIGDRSYGCGIQSADDYYRLMARDGEYAGHVELHSASEIYRDYTFKVHRNGCGRTIDYGHGPVERHLLFSGYFDAGHYSVLEY